MDPWPMQLIVVALAEDLPSSGLLDQLRASRAAGVIQVIDAGIVHKCDEGAFSLRPAPGIELDRGPYAGKLVRLLFGFGVSDKPNVWRAELARAASEKPQLFGLSCDDLAEIADAVPRASDALVLLIEHRWTTGFVESVADARE